MFSVFKGTLQMHHNIQVNHLQSSFPVQLLQQCIVILRFSKPTCLMLSWFQKKFHLTSRMQLGLPPAKTVSSAVQPVLTFTLEGVVYAAGSTLSCFQLFHPCGIVCQSGDSFPPPPLKFQGARHASHRTFRNEGVESETVSLTVGLYLWTVVVFFGH